MHRRPAADQQPEPASINCPGSAACRCWAHCSPAKSYQQNQTDLAIIVTPHLVRPARPGDVIKTPADDTLPPNDPEFFLLGKAEVTRDGGASRSRQSTAQVAAAERPSVYRPHARSAERGFPMQPSNNPLRTLALAALLAALGGCSQYLDHRETISLGGGDSVATNEVSQMVDPWPRDSADRNIAYNGDKMQSAVERYRTNKVIPPQGIGTSCELSTRPRTARTIRRRSARRSPPRR